MAISARIPSGADTAGFVLEHWSNKVIVGVKSNLVLVSLIDHTWEPELKKGDTMNVPILNTVTATEVTIGQEGPDLNIMEGTKLQITVDQMWEARIAIDEMTNLQTQVNVAEAAKVEAVDAIQKKIDSTIAALFSALNSATTYGTDGSAVTDDVLIQCVEVMDEADVPSEGRSWIFDPSTRADILKIDKFVRSDYGYGDIIPTGAFRKDIYGAPLFITNNLTVNSTGNYGCYLHKKALAIIIQEKVTTKVIPHPDKYQQVIRCHALWGVKEMRDTFGLPICTRKS